MKRAEEALQAVLFHAGIEGFRAKTFPVHFSEYALVGVGLRDGQRVLSIGGM